MKACKENFRAFQKGVTKEETEVISDEEALEGGCAHEPNASFSGRVEGQHGGGAAGCQMHWRINLEVVLLPLSVGRAASE